ncbi:MAG: hypothetical protein ACK6D3_23015 [Planctomycetaceae bacterium]|jgi:hypothetical protein
MSDFQSMSARFVAKSWVSRLSSAAQRESEVTAASSTGTGGFFYLSTSWFGSKTWLSLQLPGSRISVSAAVENAA